MDTLHPIPSNNWNSNWQRKNTEWSKEENKLFESALAMVDEKTPDRWLRLAAMTGRSVTDVINQYMALEADVSDIESDLLVPGPGCSSFSLDLMGNAMFDMFTKRGRFCDGERRRGVAWTEEEHRRFLMGLLKYGKGDWRNISRKFVISKTPTQVASHAQKYFLRQQLGGRRGGGGIQNKDSKRRPSIHDITTAHVSTSSNHPRPLKNNHFIGWNDYKFIMI